MNDASTDLSIVVPAYNEENRIATTLDEIRRYVMDRPSLAAEIIVVDDGSTDRTASVAEQKLAGLKHQVIRNEKNRGKGYSVRRGVLTAAGKVILFTDADLSTPMEEYQKFEAALQEGFDVVIGSRALPDSQIDIHQNAVRECMGKIFNRIAQLLTFKGIKDSQCGFKCFKHKAARHIFSLQKIDGFSFDAEALYLAQQLGYRIQETPVVWRNSPASRVRLASDPLKMFFDLFRICYLHRHLKSRANRY